jgi:hypothetical protein
MEKDALKKGLDFLLGTAPEVAQELVRYEQITAIIEAPFIAVIWYILIVFWLKKENRDALIKNRIYVFFVAILTYFMVLATFKWLESTIMVFLAPRAWLIKYGIKIILNAQ